MPLNLKKFLEVEKNFELGAWQSLCLKRLLTDSLPHPIIQSPFSNLNTSKRFFSGSFLRFVIKITVVGNFVLFAQQTDILFLELVSMNYISSLILVSFQIFFRRLKMGRNFVFGRFFYFVSFAFFHAKLVIENLGKLLSSLTILLWLSDMPKLGFFVQILLSYRAEKRHEFEKTCVF